MKRYYKKRNKVGNKKFNTAIDKEIARLEALRQPKIIRNGEVIDKSQDITEEILELQSLKKFKRVTMDLQSDSNRINAAYFNTPCIYRLWQDNTIVYIGQTKNLSKRIGQHIENKEFDSFDVYSYIKNDIVRLNEERRLIETHKPQYNVQHNANQNS